jgi:ubiquinone/menaquinone biosynthesis C-methylase UbiE
MYLMESENEAQRLENKFSLSTVRDQLRLVGLRDGMSVLDAGSGTGAVARAMARIVGPKGRVAALDLSWHRLHTGAEIARKGAGQPIQFVQGQLAAVPLRAQSFDLIWCRFVFEYLHEPAPVMRELTRLLKPGGKLVVLDLDNNGLIHYPMPPHLEYGIQTIRRALIEHWDPFAGRKLYHLFRTTQLQQIKIRFFPHHVYTGAAPEGDLQNWVQKFSTLRQLVAPAFGGDGEYDRFVRAFIDMLKDPDTFTYSTLILAEGVRSGSRTKDHEF